MVLSDLPCWAERKPGCELSNQPIGRPSLYSQELVDSICELVGLGYSTRSIAAMDDMPTMSTIFKWLNLYPDFAEQYSRAKEASSDADADRIQDIALRTLDGKYDPNAARVAMNGLIWSASKKKPKKYGDRIHTEHSGAVGLSDLSQDELDRKLAELKQMSESE